MWVNDDKKESCETFSSSTYNKPKPASQKHDKQLDVSAYANVIECVSLIGLHINVP